MNHPSDLAAWTHWQGQRSLLRRMRSVVPGRNATPPVLALRGTTPHILVALDSSAPALVASLLGPLDVMDSDGQAILAPSDIRAQLPVGQWTLVDLRESGAPPILDTLRAVIGSGHFLPVGKLAHEWSRQLNVPFFVVQHGLLTPHAPPLPEDAHLLAFSDADADFWCSGRSDITTDVVGSQMLWEAQRRPARGVDPGSRPVFLGQLHGAELPRAGLARAASRFCRSTEAIYRPHPSETDRLSRLQHAAWARRGISIDRSGQSFTELSAPVASVFSTGVLEAAARGIPAWVTYPSAPAWLGEFWDRYGMSQWGGDPTPAPAHPKIEPAVAIAQAIRNRVGGFL